MAADLHIHVITPVGLEQDVLESFRADFSVLKKGKSVNVEEHIEYDGKWQTMQELVKLEDLDKTKIGRRKEVVLKYDEDAINHTPSIWIGEVSWLKAGLMEDKETYVPHTVMAISELVGSSLPVITEEFITKVLDAFKLQNTTGYTLADPKEVEAFLRQYMGKKVFQISW